MERSGPSLRKSPSWLKQKQIRLLGPDEPFYALYKQAAAHLKPILFCASETGMRRGEILSLTWLRVNLRENTITLESQDTKTGRRRLIPISQRLRETLLTLRQPRGKVAEIHQHVFVSATGSPVKNIQEAFDNAVARAGLKDVHFHDLREASSLERSWKDGTGTM